MNLVGYVWSTYPRTMADVLRCLIGQHRPVLHANRDSITVSVCSCGAARQLDRAGWHYRRSVGPRRGTRELIPGVEQ